MNLLKRLKSETSSAHERIEQAFDLDARTSSLSAYRDLLARFYGFHATWEPLVEAALGDPAFFRPRRKIELLKHDLRAVGMTDSAIGQIALNLASLPIRSPAEAFGSMYVMEGSTLGGTIIARTVERRLGLGRHCGCSYFRCYGDEVGTMWKAFGATVLASCQPEDEGAVTLSAKRTFAVLHDWLCLGDTTRTDQVR